MQHIVFDIETGCEPDDVLETLFTFDESTVKNYRLLTAEFDPNEVKLGNLKDPAKIESKVEAARLKFTMDKSAVTENIDTARAEAWQAFRDRAALSPLTGRVLAIGWWNPDTPDSYAAYILEGKESVSEKEVIEHFLSLADAVLSDGGRLCGHNIIGFDLPFLLRRGLKHGIRPPKTITSALAQYRPANLVDTMREWQFGNRYEGFVKLDHLAAFFGTRRKNGDGADFGKKFFGTPEERIEALEYLNNDVMMTVEVAERMGLIALSKSKQPAEVQASTLETPASESETQEQPTQIPTDTNQDEDIY